MRQAMRVYAIVAVVVLGALLAVWWTLPDGLAQMRGWIAVLNLVVAAQLWVLLVVPLGVLVASDAGHARRRGWLATISALTVLAPIAARFDSLVAEMQDLFSSNPCLACTLGSGGQSQFLSLAGWTAALLPVPLAALIYSLTLGGRAAGAPAALGEGSGMRRVIVVFAILGIVVMAALGFLANSDFIVTHFSSGTPAHILFIGAMWMLLYQVWLVLLDALPVAVATLALAHAIRTNRRGWLAGWIAILALAMLVANLFALAATALLFTPNSAWAPGLADVQPQLQDISAVVPVVVLLVALIYALTMRSRQGQLRAALA